MGDATAGSSQGIHQVGGIVGIGGRAGAVVETGQVADAIIGVGDHRRRRQRFGHFTIEGIIGEGRRACAIHFGQSIAIRVVRVAHRWCRVCHCRRCW